MHPVLFRAGEVTIYSYGFFIALGSLAGMAWLYYKGRKEAGITLEQTNNLFLILFAAAFIGGKLFLFFERPAWYFQHPVKLLGGSGFVFYGSMLLAIPVMLWFFKKNKLPSYRMLDVMAGVTCLVHMFGRIGCFMAGCCYGLPSSGFFTVTFTHAACQARPLHTPLFPSQLAEAAYIGMVFLLLLAVYNKRSFFGQVFLVYLALYAAGRFVLEYFRGDEERGFLWHNYLSNAQFVSLLLVAVVVYLYPKWKRKNAVHSFSQ
ncbi:MAG: prolipoprotein diacylglyceryl transferase [Cyclobacteriaceae bacterium]|nr:MAG: prolipoprotein diacylglyceryl transferase [Cyclobacteriaceae bacterium]